jgi:chromosome segregation ATPase
MAKESKRKIKPKTSPPKYVSIDDELGSSDEEDEDEEVLLNDMSNSLKVRIKRLLSQVGIRDELLDHQAKLLIQEKESNQELKRLLKLEKEKKEKLDQELTQSKETISSLKSTCAALQNTYDVLQKTHKDLEVQFDALWSSTFKPSNNNEVSTSQVSVETCDEAIAKENDHLKLEIKMLE